VHEHRTVNQPSDEWGFIWPQVGSSRWPRSSLVAGRPIRGSRAVAPLELPLLAVKHAGPVEQDFYLRDPEKRFVGTVLSVYSSVSGSPATAASAMRLRAAIPEVVLREYLRNS
jgi:hypothetical protein